MEHRSEAELDRIVAALAAGDAAFTVTLVARHGTAMARMARRRGVRDEDRDRVIEAVAFALLGRPVPANGSARDAVVAAFDQVLADAPGTPPPTDAPQAGSAGAPSAGARCEPTAAAVTSAAETATAAHPSWRTLHLVDIENLAGGPARVDEWFVSSLAAYTTVARPGDADLVVLAADRTVWVRTAWDVDPAWDYRFGTGPDGADRVLLEAADPDWVVDRFDRLVVGSGDHAFAPLLADVRRRGVTTLVVSRAHQLADVLRRTAARVVPLPDLPPARTSTAAGEVVFAA